MPTLATQVLVQAVQLASAPSEGCGMPLEVAGGEGLAILAEAEGKARPTRSACHIRQGLTGDEDCLVATTMPTVAARAMPTPKRDELVSPKPPAPLPVPLPDVLPPLPDCSPAGGADWLERANAGLAIRSAAVAADKTKERIKFPPGGWSG
jgi:hypothetical protein